MVSTEGVADNVTRCIQKLLASQTEGQDELDQNVVSDVKITLVPPSTSGFPAWSRQGEKVESANDTDRGHADWVVPIGAGNAKPRILYLHGGGYEFFSPQDVYRPATSRLAASTGFPVLCIDYRLVPEFRHPAQLEDADLAFRWIAENGPDGPSKASAIFLAGDSAGGGLALALAVRLREYPVHGHRVSGVSVMSPLTDLSCSGESYTTRRWVEGGGAQCDIFFNDADPAASSMDTIYKLLGKPGDSGSFPVTEPSISVMHAELHGLPPTLIQVGDAEVMLSDAVDFGKKATKAGSPVTVKVWPRMWHTFAQYSEGCGGEDAEPLREALEALALQAKFLKACLPSPKLSQLCCCGRD
eukprot:TRINITY_DN56496_c0_g1_i1.p1 TRINITY_DN56496_c0_g1~~TRINITY_DN56496_c0_g1_i1.p1  ORF type:complete len:357 (-),score=43.09 TRINITY_DN56496_c0_g1_i1:99-1169(-)